MDAQTDTMRSARPSTDFACVGQGLQHQQLRAEWGSARGASGARVAWKLAGTGAGTRAGMQPRAAHLKVAPS